MYQSSKRCHGIALSLGVLIVFASFHSHHSSSLVGDLSRANQRTRTRHGILGINVHRCISLLLYNGNSQEESSVHLHTWIDLGVILPDSFKLARLPPWSILGVPLSPDMKVMPESNSIAILKTHSCADY
ncbi:hypothetical protein OG21DRAFT_9370 [Imleria badia]|nr:hypothetical protein OG21DRAFT_9370 [Imleria badia]